jgi:hypothetical protein
MKMLAPELSPATVFWSQIETKIAKYDIGEAQRDPCYILKYFRIISIVSYQNVIIKINTIIIIINIIYHIQMYLALI